MREEELKGCLKCGGEYFLGKVFGKVFLWAIFRGMFNIRPRLGYKSE